MRKLEIVGHVFSNVNGRIIVTPPEGVSQREQGIETYLENSNLFPDLANGEWEKLPNGGFKSTKYKRADKIAKVPKVKITITVEDLP